MAISFVYKGLVRALLVFALAAAFAVPSLAQQVVDKTIATVTDGARTELITLSDIRWQLALQPETPIDSPSQEDYEQALQLLIDQRTFALEAERLPRLAPTEDEINAKIAEIVSYFPTAAEFERRLKLVGFTSIRDDNFERIIAQRVAIDKYLDFRFRSFIVITAADEERYYRETFVPEYRANSPGQLMPTLDSQRARISRLLTERRVAAQIEAFLDEARRRIRTTRLLPI